ncbi:MAG TPA: ABC transporter ATP-binding protein [Polyangiaceae bacterium LLY-WYZ-15_(1-7)]|nr:ABC transporter ATP-binding protein [Polyangiaceae bacterium LLY-WYZ-15_(1-7)]HJL01882.1 ABC transporter ATP-binding protein [Polyangiaceae bacterium LLY-WYZ-15_(1-7)]HJL08443.1 ABC transporter ATP-binding protein [Polyangiaceae bacterium LLY-WYZ-15_(1-7)]HJL20984.1 ABC transporter ATP-binding protein [Polyangiaceae bacterium LLY-WYZ-15_(1-7)]HJL30306.1 ABC transporter ATP-binding protein [Polyangiaceae bacterium LLY-WYZ-15_(1-7)]
MATLIELEGVEKRYGELRALKDLSLTLQEGRIGLLGPNGAGKSTLLKTLLGLVEHDHGMVKVFGEEVRRDPFKVRARIGYMPEGDSVLPELTALQYASFAAELCGLPKAEAKARAHQVLHYVGLGEARYRRLGSFSTGMKQRVRLAQALVGDPKLILLDEPTSGLDPRGRDEMLQLILDIPSRTGASVILSTHILPDVEKTCDQVVVLAQGEVLYAGELAPLVAPEEGIYEVRTKGDPEPFRRALEMGRCVVTMQGANLEVRVPKGEDGRHILRVAVENGMQVRHLAPLVKTLERAFMQTLRDAGKA